MFKINNLKKHLLFLYQAKYLNSERKYKQKYYSRINSKYVHEESSLTQQSISFVGFNSLKA